MLNSSKRLSSSKNSDTQILFDKSSCQTNKSSIKPIKKNLKLLISIDSNEDLSSTLNSSKSLKKRKDKFGNTITKTLKDHKVAFSNNLVEVVPVHNYKVLNKKNNFKSSNNQCCLIC